MSARASPVAASGRAASAGSTRARALGWLVTGVLALALGGLALFVRRFALTRFFSIDEYQWGHATWLVAMGQVPYRDFYEHHLPLGYSLHAAVLPRTGSFVERALLLREISLVYVGVGTAAVAAATYVARRDRCEALLVALVPPSVGFGLMSAIDYRGDSWAAFVLLCSFAALDLERSLGRRWLAVVAGVCFACAALMTQKSLLLGGLALAPLLLASSGRIRARLPRLLAPAAELRIAHPAAFCAAALAPGLAFIAVFAGLGQLGRVFEINVRDALVHERIYPGFSVWKYFEPYFSSAPLSTSAIAVAAAASIVLRPPSLWGLSCAAALIGSALIKAPYPYNFVLPSVLVGMCAVHGYCAVVRWCGRRWARARGILPAAYLLPLLVVPAQLRFVEGRSTNREQLETLRQIERYTGEDDVVIDSEGSALFRPHRSYYWYQGAAHVMMFLDYFQEQLPLDLRQTQAIFWLNGFRSRQLPEAAQRYLEQHYVRFRGDLFVLGVELPAPPGGAQEHDVDVVRAGDYFAAPLAAGPEAGQGRGAALATVDGLPLPAGGVHLDVGVHRVALPPGSPGVRLSYLPPSAFQLERQLGRHAPLFEFERVW